MYRLSKPSRSAAHAFTMIELMVVVILMGIVAVTVMPAMDNVRLMREGAARDDVMRLLELARARAMAVGSPNGLSINLESSSFTLVHITGSGEIETVIDPLTYQSRTLSLPVTYPGVTINSMLNGDGEAGSGIVWFDFEANPHTRDLNGGFVVLNDEDVRIELSSDETVVVHAFTGVVELR